MFENVDWHKVFMPDTPLLEILVRGTVVYVALVVLLRVILKRQSGTLGITDLLFVVLIADAAQNAMSDDYSSIADGILLVAVIIGWSYLLDWLAFHFKGVHRLLIPAPLPLVEHGRMLRRNMKQELVTEEELMVQLREQGVEDLSKVKVARMESDGRISVVCYEGPQQNGAPEKRGI